MRGAGVVVQDVCLDWTLARSYMRLRFMPHQCVLLKVTRIHSRDHLDRVMQTQASLLNARVRARALRVPQSLWNILVNSSLRALGGPGKLCKTYIKVQKDPFVHPRSCAPAWDLEAGLLPRKNPDAYVCACAFCRFQTP